MVLIYAEALLFQRILMKRANNAEYCRGKATRIRNRFALFEKEECGAQGNCNMLQDNLLRYFCARPLNLTDVCILRSGVEENGVEENGVEENGRSS